MASKDSFLFLFAEKDDIYFTEHMLKLDLNQYLYHQLKKKSFEEIYFLEFLSGDEMRVSCENESAGDTYIAKTPRGFRSIVLGETPKFTPDITGGRKRYSLKQKKDMVKTTIAALIGTNDEDRYAFVMDAQNFKRFCPSEFERNTLADVLIHRRYKSQFILVEPLQSKEILPPLPLNIFSQEQQDAINRNAGEVLLSQRLKESNDLLLSTWNVFDRKQLRRMLQRSCVEMQQSPALLEAQERFLDHSLKLMEQDRFLDMTIRRKKDLYDKILTQRNKLDELNRLIKSSRNI